MFRKSFLSIVAIATASFVFALDVPTNRVVDTAWLKENITDDSIVLIDLREDAGVYKQNHIPNAVNWVVNDFREARGGLPGYIGSPTQFERLVQNSGITENSTIIFYTDGNKSATDYTAATLALHIGDYYGLKNSAILNGGYAAWVKDGGEVNSDKVKPNRSNFIIQEINPEDVATVYDVDDAVVTKEWVLMDGRNEPQFKGESAHAKASKAGHLSGANSLFISKFVENKDGIFYMYTDKDKVADLINQAGGDVNEPTLWYCNTGWFATGGWFMSKFIVGTPKVKAYDGSMNEYSSYPKREVIKGE